MNENLTAWNQLRERVLSTEQVRSVDRLAVEEYGMHSLVLMENAAIGCVQWLLSVYGEPQPITILCGRGNNGGDGLAIARHLTNCGWPCRIVLLGPIEKLSADARANYQWLTHAGGLQPEIYLETDDAPPLDLSRSRVIVDAMLGTGATGDPRPPLAGWIQAANTTNAFRLAIDIPTGVDAESGKCGTPAFAADATLTFVARKPAMVERETAALFGTIHVLPIGVPAQLIRRLLA